MPLLLKPALASGANEPSCRNIWADDELWLSSSLSSLSDSSSIPLPSSAGRMTVRTSSPSRRASIDCRLIDWRSDSLGGGLGAASSSSLLLSAAGPSRFSGLKWRPLGRRSSRNAGELCGRLLDAVLFEPEWLDEADESTELTTVPYGACRETGPRTGFGRVPLDDLAPGLGGNEIGIDERPALSRCSRNCSRARSISSSSSSSASASSASGGS